MLLDSYTPLFVYGFDKYHQNATYAAQIRRSSDDALADIGFTPGGLFDQDAYNLHVGAGSGYMRSFYEQSGSGRHLVQADNARQPLVVLDGLGGKPCARWDNFDDSMVHSPAANFYSGTTATFFVAFEDWADPDLYDGMLSVSGYNNPNDYGTIGMVIPFTIRGVGSLWGYRNGNMSTRALPAINTPSVGVSRWTGAQNILYIDGLPGNTVASSGAFGFGRITVGSRFESGAPSRTFPCKISAMFGVTEHSPSTLDVVGSDLAGRIGSSWSYVGSVPVSLSGQLSMAGVRSSGFFRSLSGVISSGGGIVRGLYRGLSGAVGFLRGLLPVLSADDLLDVEVRSFLPTELSVSDGASYSISLSDVLVQDVELSDHTRS